MNTRIARIGASLLLLASTVAAAGLGHSDEATAATCAKAPAWSPTSTKLGMSLSVSSGGNLGDDLAVEEKRFGTRVPVIRTWDTGMPRTDAWKQRSSWYGTRWIVTSLKIAPQDILAGKYDTQLANYFATAPTAAPIFWSYYHEPEDEVKAGKFTATQYRDAFKRVADIAAKQCRSNLYPTVILMGWTADPSSKLNWKDYYPGADYVSVLGWDPYNGAHGDATSYRDPATIFDPVVTASASVGKPFGIAETGTVRIPGDSAGTGRAAWLTKTATYLKGKKAVFATYFQSTNNGDFELRDAPSVTAWAAAMR